MSPTPIRPLSPTRDCSPVHPIIQCSKVVHSKLDVGSEDDEVEMELGREIFHILQGSTLSVSRGPVHTLSDSDAGVKPPSRNQNPLVKDKRFERERDMNSRDRDVEASASFMIDSQCSDGYRSALRFSPQEITVG